MEKKINLVKLLKDCPKGMELDCPIFSGLEFDCIDENNGICPIICRVKTEFNSCNIHTFTEYGCYSTAKYAKCVIFPKGKTTWEGFVPPCKFKAGDVLVSRAGNMVLFSHIDSDNLVHYHCIIPTYGSIRIAENTSIGVGRYDECVLANEQQRQRMYNQIKCSGYKYNQEINKLEKLIELKFKDGDVISVIINKNPWYGIYQKEFNKQLYCHVSYSTVTKSIYTNLNKNGTCSINSISEARLATEAEKQILFDAIKEDGYKWNSETKTLEKLNEPEPKFKIGNKIKEKGTNTYVQIKAIIKDKYQTYYETLLGGIPVRLQDNWELIPDKFNFSTLIPFESKVLVRNTNIDTWKPSFWGCLLDSGNFETVRGIYSQCIPYSGNEYLLGRLDNCDDYFKIWE